MRGSPTGEPSEALPITGEREGGCRSANAYACGPHIYRYIYIIYVMYTLQWFRVR